MKTFTIELPNVKADRKGIYKNYLLNRLAQSYPELIISGMDNQELITSLKYVGPNDKIVIGNNPFSRADVSGCPFYSTCRFAKKDYNIATDFERAMKALDEYYKEKLGYKKLYDFKLADGTPVKEYQNFIQIGYNVIPKNDIYSTISRMNKKSRMQIINFIMIVNNTINF